MNLLDAFEKITDLEYRLWICGEGELRKEIIKRSRRDPRIIYYGQIPRERVLQLQREATVLVNPRTSEGEFTKYSFPSKTMEYLASGTPSIIHKLPGIPDEYFKFCFVPEEENSNGLYNMIVKVCEMESSELEIFGRKAQDFILKFKNPSYQCGKILLMLNQL
jgi:glycosyltransferase involved in cell wall biosynthesis